MAFQVSPGVNVSEIDTTTVTAVTGVSVGAFAGQFKWGPALKRVSVDSENTLVSIFNKPDSNNFASFFSAANFLSYTNDLVVVRAVAATTNNSTSLTYGASIENEDDWELNYSTNGTTLASIGTFAGRYPGTLGNSLTVAVCSSNTAFKSNTMTVTPTGTTSITFPINIAVAYPNYSAGDIIAVNGIDYTLASAPLGAVATLTTAPPAATSVPASLAWKYYKSFSAAPGTSIYGTRQGAIGDEMHIAIIDTDGKFSGVQGTILEKFDRVSKAIDARTDDGSPNYYVTKIFDSSQYIYSAATLAGGTNWGSIAAGITFSNVSNYSIKLSGGTDTAPTDANIVSAYNLFSNKDEVDISFIIAGEASATVVNAISSLANQRKDCIAAFSPLRQDAVTSINIDNIVNFRNSITPSTSYAVMDSGYKYQFDKYNNVYRYIPLNADIAGLCARTDATRDPWVSPAGFSRGQILNVIKLSWNPSQSQRDTLYQNNINPVVAFPGQGIILYGDKTLQAQSSAFDHINVRRLFIILEKTISTAAKYSLFEFNDEFTRSQFVSLVEPFLRDIKGRRGIYDFRVICDTTNNTSQVIDSNAFVGDIYIKPAKSINFIQLNFIAVGTGIDFSTIAG
jgi:hypothetical protein